jgi:hypothetical protein
MSFDGRGRSSTSHAEDLRAASLARSTLFKRGMGANLTWTTTVRASRLAQFAHSRLSMRRSGMPHTNLLIVKCFARTAREASKDARKTCRPRHPLSRPAPPAPLSREGRGWAHEPSDPLSEPRLDNDRGGAGRFTRFTPLRRVPFRVARNVAWRCVSALSFFLSGASRHGFRVPTQRSAARTPILNHSRARCGAHGMTAVKRQEQSPSPGRLRRPPSPARGEGSRTSVSSIQRASRNGSHVCAAPQPGGVRILDHRECAAARTG